MTPIQSDINIIGQLCSASIAKIKFHILGSKCNKKGKTKMSKGSVEKL